MADIKEKDLEDFLWAHPEAVGIDRWIARQLRLPSGIADLVGLRVGRLYVAELKAVPADGHTVAQVLRYMGNLNDVLYTSLLNQDGMQWEVDANYDTRGMIVAPAIDDKSFASTKALYMDVLTYKVSVAFDLHAVSWTDEYMEKASKRTTQICQDKVWDDVWQYMVAHDRATEAAIELWSGSSAPLSEVEEEQQ